LLQSGQADDESLISALARQEYAHIFHLSLSILDDPEIAGKVAREILAIAVVDSHCYREDLTVQVWLSHLTIKKCLRLSPQLRLRKAPALLKSKSVGEVNSNSPIPESWQSYDPQEGKDGVAFIQNEVEDLPVGDLNETLAGVQMLVRSIRRRRQRTTVFQEIALAGAAILLVLFFGNLATAFSPNPAPTATVFQTALVMQLIYITPTPDPSATPTPFPERAVLTTVQAGETLVEVADRIGTSVEILRALNSLSPDEPLQPGQQVMIGVGGPPLSLITPTPVTPVPPPEPLTANSSADAIRQRIFESRLNWWTLWADVEAIRYGPPGYVGPPQLTREQVWISQPYYSLGYSGDMKGDLHFLRLSIGGQTYQHNLETGGFLVSNGGGTVDYSMAAHELLVPSPFRWSFEGELEVIGVEPIAGRETLVIDWYAADSTFLNAGSTLADQGSYLGRYWVDTVTGVILRRVIIDENDPRLLLDEVIVTAITFDLDIPNRLFDSYQPIPKRIARDGQGEPLPPDVVLPSPTWLPAPGRMPLLRTPAPPDFDLSRSRLVFQWTGTGFIDSDSADVADIFARGFYLGSVELADPAQMICARSPDGQRIAYSEWLEDPPFSLAPVRWFSLLRLPEVNEPMPEFIPADFAFAPDSRRLALSGCWGETQNCGVHILDLDNGEHRLILALANAYSLTWSPDGEALAWLGSIQPGGMERAWVINVQTGEVIYTGTLSNDDDRAVLDSFVTPWNVSFPASRGGLEACAEPPAAR
jgi:hypothetical protein